jgi:hypothetical protein
MKNELDSLQQTNPDLLLEFAYLYDTTQEKASDNRIKANVVWSE